MLNEKKQPWLKYFREQKESLQHIINKATNENIEISVPAFLVQESYQNNYVSFLNFLVEKMSCKIEKFVQNIQGCSKKILESKEIFAFYLDFAGNANLDENLYGFKRGTKTFIEFNTLTLSINKREFDIDTNQGCLACLCQIPNNKLFYYGGHEPSVGSAFIIDLKTFERIPFEKPRDRSTTFATYWNDFIFIFCGYYSGSYINCSEKYNLISKEWKRITNFPENNRQYICALPCEDYFILSNQLEKNLYIYNLSKDKYEILTSSVNNTQMNILFRNLKNYYYISGNSLFKSNQENLQKWVQTPKTLSVALTYNTSKPVMREKFVYIMATYYGKIYRFDLEIEDLFEVTSF